MVAFSRNGQQLASGSVDGTVQVYSRRSGTGVVGPPVVEPPGGGGSIGDFDPSAWVGESPVAREVFREFYKTLEPANIRSAFAEILVAVNKPDVQNAFEGANSKVTSNLNSSFARVNMGISNQYDTVHAANSSFFTNSKVLELLRTPDEINAFLPVLRNSAQFDALGTHFTTPKTIGVSPTSWTGEPGQSRTLTFTVTLRDGRRAPDGTAIEVTVNSPGWFKDTSQQNVTTLGVVTGSSGTVAVTLYTRETSASTSSPTDTYTVTATVKKHKDVKTSASYRTRWVPGALTVSPSSSFSITSGDSRTITATVKSTGGTRMSGVAVNFMESSRLIAFSSTSGTTNSSGKVSTTLRSGSKGSASISVKSPGDTDSRTVTVNPDTASKTLHDNYVGRRIGIWESNYWYDHEMTFAFPGDVVSANVRSSTYRVNVKTGTISGRYVTVPMRVLAKTLPRADVDVWVDATYEVLASAPGAPALHSQFGPETQQLSTFWQDLSRVPEETALLPNYPNPFNPETWIPYRLAESAEVTLSIYSLNGNRVRTLALGHQPAGFYESRSRAAYWDGRNAIGERVASGVYFYTLSAGNFSATRKMVIRK